MSRLLALILAFWVLACDPPPEVRPEARAIEAFLGNLHKSSEFNGAVIVGLRGNILFEGGWGVANGEAGTTMTPDTPVDGASLAKTLVAASVWQLASEERLELDQPVAHYVAEFPAPTVTLRHLLEHSAGLPAWPDPEGLTTAELVEGIGQLSFPPGSRRSYCNECFDVLALVTERVSGLPWEKLLRRLYFEPLAMTSAFLRPTRLADWPGTRTLSYESDGSSLQLADIADNEAFYGSSNLYLSARDLHQWATAHATRHAVLAEEMRSGLEIPEISGQVSALNRLNWFYGSADGPFHFNGHLRSFHHEVYWDPATSLTVVWVSNVSGSRPPPQLITRTLVALALGSELEPWRRIEGSSADPQSVYGVYQVPGLGQVRVGPGQFVPEFEIDGGPAYNCYPSFGYYLPDFDAEVGFAEVDAEDKYQELHWITTERTLLGRRL